MGLGSILKSGLKILGTSNPITAGIGTALEIGGGLKQIFGKDRYGDPYTQSYRQLSGAFKAADDAGLHRLAVAGSPAGYSPVPAQAAEGFLNAGRALRSGPSAKENELLDAQIAEARSRTALNNANAKRAFLGPQPGLGGYSTRIGDLVSSHADRAGNDRGVRVVPESDSALTGTVNLGNTTMKAPSEDAFSVGLDELVAGALIYGSQWVTAQIRKMGEKARSGAKEKPGREAARRSASERNRRANQSPYLFGK